MKRLILLLALSVSQLGYGQNASEADRKGIDATINELYAIISGPAGERDWDRFKSLFHEDVVMGSVGRDEAGKGYPSLYKPQGYIERNAAFFKENPFFEEEIGRKVTVFGSIAAVMTAYRFRTSKEGPYLRRGVNSIQLIKSGERWLITQLIWQEERPYLPIPNEMLFKRFQK